MALWRILGLPVGIGGQTDPSLTLFHDFTLTQSNRIGPSLTFSRASGATQFNAAGQLVWAPENLVLQSENFNDAVWSKATCSVENAVSPTGATNASKVIPTIGAGVKGLLQTTIPIVAGLTYTYAVYVKQADGTNFVLLQLDSDVWQSAPSSSRPRLWVNLATGESVSERVISSSVVDVGNGWWRASITVTASSTVNTALRINGASGFSNTTVTGDGVGGFLAFGAHFQRIPNASTDYIPTTSSRVYGRRVNHIYNGTAWVPAGLLIEGQATNLCLYSEEPSNAAWLRSGITIIDNTAIAPDGVLSGDTLVESNLSEQHGASSPSISFVPGTTYTATVYTKDNGRFLRLLFPGAAFGSTSGANFNLVDGSVATLVGSATATIQDVGNGWFRCSITATASASSSSRISIATAATASGVSNYAGDGVSGIFLWGAQIEVASFATSYIPTTAAAVTRSADVASISGADFSGFYNQSEGTWVVEGNMVTDLSASMLYANSGSVDNSQRVGHVSTATLQMLSRSGGVTDGLLSFGAVTTAEPFKLSAAYANNDLAGSRSGAAVVTDNSSLLPAGINNLIVGRGQTATGQINGHIKFIRYYNTRKPNAFLEQITTIL